MGIFDDIGLPDPRDIADAFTGRTGAEAALEGAASQTQLGREGLQATEQQQARLRETLSPFVGLGTGQLGQAQNLFGQQAGQSVLNDPAFQQAAQRQELLTLIQQANQGRLNTGETGERLIGGLGQLGSDFLSRQRGDILGPLQIGQASAAQTASSGLQSAGQRADILTQIGNAQAAGGVGAAESLGQGAQNAAGGIGALFSVFCDRRLKTDITETGEHMGYKTYMYRYKGSSQLIHGYMSDDVRAKNPGAVSIHSSGYDVINLGLM